MERLARGALLVADPTRINPVDRWMDFATLVSLVATPGRLPETA